MCGIYASLSRARKLELSASLNARICARGPDYEGNERRQVVDEHGDTVYLSFFATVLSLRGSHIVPQPLVDDETGSLLCWNGEAWKISDCVIQSNDGLRILQLLIDCSDSSMEESVRKVLLVLCTVSGPFAFVYFDKMHDLLYFGRDRLGRRSLLYHVDAIGSIQLSSVAETASDQWLEVEADGIYMIECKSEVDGAKNSHSFPNSMVKHFPWPSKPIKDTSSSFLGTLNRVLPSGDIPSLIRNSLSVKELSLHLQSSLRLRVLGIPITHSMPDDEARLAVLFSGGLDCTVLARMAHDLLPLKQAIDLLNVAFENPRVIQAHQKEAKKMGTHCTPDPDFYELCPDRVTGRGAVTELRKACPGRTWRFVAINIPYTEATSHQSTVVSLIHPHNTEMDLSIALALYFASRGSGRASSSPSTDTAEECYTTTARVLLSGLGADELFGGYTRHATAFTRHGMSSLIGELDIDVSRLGKRNLGRDDRVISHWGKEARYPYLDEELVRWALSKPVWEKCDFGAAQVPGDDDIEPGKKVLRLLAQELGLHGVAREKKRAVSNRPIITVPEAQPGYLTLTDPIRGSDGENGNRKDKRHELDIVTRYAT